MSNSNWATVKQPYFNPWGRGGWVYIFFFFAHSILDRLLFMVMIVFEIAIPNLINRSDEAQYQ